jgi:glycosyltransferase involved in cell wall biosynthesis
VLPAFNEEAVIAETVRRTAAALTELGVADFEILVVDDGSSDATAARASSALGPNTQLRVISHPRNRGYGAALRTGFDAATREAVFLMDSDGQFDPLEMSRLLALYGPDRVICGYRIRRRDTWARRFYHTAFFGLVRLGFGATARDVNCAFKLFPRAVGKGLHAEGALVSTELLVRARRSGYRLMDVGVHHYPRTTGHATGASIRVVLRAFRELWQLRNAPALLDGLEPPA